MLANGFYRAAMATGELLFTGVAVVDDDCDSAIEAGEDVIGFALSEQWNFDTFVFFGLNRVAVEEFEFIRRCRRPGFYEAAMAGVDAQGAMRRNDFDRKRVEE